MSQAQRDFERYRDQWPPMILDGGLATELERRGCDLNHPLWSAKIIAEQPNLIRQIHLDYLKAGADIITTAGYQASFPGLREQGYSYEEAVALMKKAVNLAVEAREEYHRSTPDSADRPKLIAASAGPYGAYLADGSEYRGNYGVPRRVLEEFHAERMELLVNSPADIVAYETIPSLEEAKVIIKLASRFPEKAFWISFSCRDGEHISDGTPAVVAFREVHESTIAAVGINCTHPRYMKELVSWAFADALPQPIVIYPNSGEKYDPLKKQWAGNFESGKWIDLVLGAEASIIGGCCRVGVKEIAELAGMVRKEKARNRSRDSGT
jgi:homocysteine S-methyltransferase